MESDGTLSGNTFRRYSHHLAKAGCRGYVIIPTSARRAGRRKLESKKEAGLTSRLDRRPRNKRLSTFAFVTTEFGSTAAALHAVDSAVLDIMTTKVQTKNRFSDEALLHVAAIEQAVARYETAKKRDNELKAKLDGAKLQVDAILNDRDAEIADCVERLVLSDARVRILEHRLSTGAGNSAGTALVELATAVDQAEGFTLGASGYLARTIRQQKIQEIAQELGVNPAKVSSSEMVVAKHPRAVAAEALGLASRLSHFIDLDRISEVSALQHAKSVLLKLRKLADFEFEENVDPLPESEARVSDGA